MKGIFSALVSALALSNTDSNPSPASNRFAVAAEPARTGSATVVDLGTAIDYTILAESGISTVPNSNVEGNIGVSPIDSTAITGFALILDESGQFSTSTQVSGRVYAADYADPTPADLTTAVNDMLTAYNNAAAETPADFTNLGGGEIGGMILQPGIYKFTTGVNIATVLTLNGACDDVFVFQISGALTEAAATQIVLTGGVLASRIFWQVAGGVTIGTTATFQGTILSAVTVTLQTGSTVNGRVYSQTNVALQQATVNIPTAFDPATCTSVTTTATTATTTDTTATTTTTTATTDTTTATTDTTIGTTVTTLATTSPSDIATNPSVTATDGSGTGDTLGTPSPTEGTTAGTDNGRTTEGQPGLTTSTGILTTEIITGTIPTTAGATGLSALTTITSMGLSSTFTSTVFTDTSSFTTEGITTTSCVCPITVTAVSTVTVTVRDCTISPTPPGSISMATPIPPPTVTTPVPSPVMTTPVPPPVMTTPASSPSVITLTSDVTTASSDVTVPPSPAPSANSATETANASSPTVTTRASSPAATAQTSSPMLTTHTTNSASAAASSSSLSALSCSSSVSSSIYGQCSASVSSSASSVASSVCAAPTSSSMLTPGDVIVNSTSGAGTLRGWGLAGVAGLFGMAVFLV